MTRNEYLELADWRRRVAQMWDAWRLGSAVDPGRATSAFRAAKDRLFADHPQSPLLPQERGAFQGLAYWPYDPAWRMEVPFEPDAMGARGPHGDDSTAWAGTGAVGAERAVGAAPSTAGFGGTAGTAGMAGFGGTAGMAGFGATVGTAGFGGLMELPSSGLGGIPFRRIGRVLLSGPLTGHALPVYWIDAYGGGLFLPFRDATAGRETYGAGRYLLDTIKSADHGGNPERGTLVLDFNMGYHPSCAYDPRWSCPLAPADNRLALPIAIGERLRPDGGTHR